MGLEGKPPPGSGLKKQKTQKNSQNYGKKNSQDIEMSNISSAKHKSNSLRPGSSDQNRSRQDNGEQYTTHNNIITSTQKKQMQVLNMPVSRPISAKMQQDSFMSDAHANETPIGGDQMKYAQEEAKRVRGQMSEDMDDSFHTSDGSSFSKDDVSEESHQFSSEEENSVAFSSESDEELDLNDQPIRVYDARFKIPAQSNIGQLMSAKNSADLTRTQSNKQYRTTVKRLERYKKFVSSTAILLMGGAMIFNIVYYGLLINNLQKDKYFVARTIYNSTQTIDFEELSVEEIKYFLIKNDTEGAEDAGTDLNAYIVGDINTICNSTGYFLESDSERLTSVRDNINASFMLASEAYVLLLMTVLMIFVTIIIPQKMKEHHVPMLMREADENMFHVMMRIRCMVFLVYMTLSGCLCHLTNLFTDTCLHTENEPMLFDDFDVNMTDYYQFCLISLVWFISIPVSCFFVGAYFKDASRYSVIPCMITSVVFFGLTFLISAVCILNMMLNGNGYMVRAVQGANLFVYFYCQFFNMIYSAKYAKRDLLRSEEEEIDV